MYSNLWPTETLHLHNHQCSLNVLKHQIFSVWIYYVPAGCSLRLTHNTIVHYLMFNMGLKGNCCSIKEGVACYYDNWHHYHLHPFYSRQGIQVGWVSLSILFLQWYGTVGISREFTFCNNCSTVWASPFCSMQSVCTMVADSAVIAILSG